MQIRSSSFAPISERSNLCSRFHDLEIKTRIVQSDMTKLRVENKIKLHIVIIMKLDRAVKFLQIVLPRAWFVGKRISTIEEVSSDSNVTVTPRSAKMRQGHRRKATTRRSLAKSRGFLASLLSM